MKSVIASFIVFVAASSAYALPTQTATVERTALGESTMSYFIVHFDHTKQDGTVVTSNSKLVPMNEGVADVLEAMPRESTLKCDLRGTFSGSEFLVYSLQNCH